MSRRRQAILGSSAIALVAAAAIALAGRLCYIQLAMRPKIVAWTENQQQGRITIPARRGLILDRRARVLAASYDGPSVFADPGLIGDAQATASKLAPVLDVHPLELSQKLTAHAGERFVWLRRYLDKNQSEAIRELNIRGIGLIQEPRRHYPMGPLLAHVIGFVGHGQNGQPKGLEGIERRFDEVLAGSNGSANVICDARRRPVWHQKDNYAPPRDGSHVVLTVDATLQQIVEHELGRAVADFEAESGVAIMMAPRTGEVLAMACVPGFDPNHYADYAASIRRNRALTDPAEPGSTFKPFVAAAALAERTVHLDERIFCHRGLYVTSGRVLHDHHPYGNLTFREVLTKSSNIGMAVIAQRLGNVRVHRYLRAFGFGDVTGIEMPGESRGIVPTLTKWTSYSGTSAAFGQEIAVTPLQLITSFCAIVNDGLLLRPRIVRAVIDPSGKIIEDRGQPIGVRRVLDRTVARTMSRQILIAVINEGTGKNAALTDYQVLGKTGTAQVPFRGRRGYEPDAYVSSFVGAAPASDPRIAVLVMIRRPRHDLGYYGGTVAAPAVREIMAAALTYLRVPPDKPRVHLKCARRAMR